MQRAGHETLGSSRTAHSPLSSDLAAPALSLRLRPEDAAPPDSARPHRRQEALAALIRQRIETRLRGRLRNLIVRVERDVVTLEGECATYYTKQIAQHAAMGVLDDEQLDNAIVVNVPR